MHKKSRKVRSNQKDIHPRLLKVVEKHKTTLFNKPYAAHTIEAFYRLDGKIQKTNRPVVLDSGCGTGKSSLLLAKHHADALVIGIDKSAHRLEKFHAMGAEQPANLLLVRADLIDFWRLAHKEGWPVWKNYILYPNPWPKKHQLKKRFHGHPVFFQLLNLSEQLELRSNWPLYIAEFAKAVEYTSGQICRVAQIIPTQPISPFENKYLTSGHPLFRLTYSRNPNLASSRSLNTG